MLWLWINVLLSEKACSPKIIFINRGLEKFDSPTCVYEIK